MPIPVVVLAALNILGAALAGKEVYDLFGESKEKKMSRDQKKIMQIERLLGDSESFGVSELERELRREGDLITSLEKVGSRANDAATAVKEAESIRFQEMLVREQQTLNNMATRLPPSIPEVAASLGIGL